jgi:protein MpaA
MSSIIRRLLLTMAYISAAVLMSGCADVAQTLENLLHPRPAHVRVAGYSVRNRPIEYSVHGTDGQTVLILGAIHGDEPASAALVTQLQKHLVSTPPSPDSVRVVVLPVANPDGLTAGTHGNANGVDLNRNFLTANRIDCADFGFEGLSEPESRAIKRLIERYKPVRIVSVHQPLQCVDYDGPAQNLAEMISSASGLPVRKLGAMPGSLGSYAGETLHIAIITLELPPDAEKLDPAELWEIYGPALLTAIGPPVVIGSPQQD